MPEQAPSPKDRPLVTATTATLPKTGDAPKTAPPASANLSGNSEKLAKPATQADKDPMRQLLDRLAATEGLLASVDPNLARTIRSLVRQRHDAERLSQPGFRHEVAYAFQDIERSPVGRIDIAAKLRGELTQLAGSAPGLQNERMLALMRGTVSLGDRALVREIREAAAEIGRQADQTTENIQSRIDTLDNRLRLGLRLAQPAPTAGGGIEPPTSAPQARTFDRPAADDGIQSARPFGGAPTDEGPAQAGGQRQRQQTRPVLDVLLSGMRPRDQGTGAPWDPPPTPMAERLTAFEKRMQDGADEQAFRRAEKSGRAALDAMQGFSAGEGAAVMNRIRDASRAEPGGIAAVLSEMRDGGRFADLRKEFNTALATERGVAAAYDRAASALGRYGQERASVQDIIGRRADASAITARFQEIDAEIGQAAATTPSRADGRRMIDDLAENAAKTLHRAVEAMKSAFNRSPSADAASRPAPAPSMSG